MFGTRCPKYKKHPEQWTPLLVLLSELSSSNTPFWPCSGNQERTRHICNCKQPTVVFQIRNYILVTYISGPNNLSLYKSSQNKTTTIYAIFKVDMFLILPLSHKQRRDSNEFSGQNLKPLSLKIEIQQRKMKKIYILTP